MSRIFAMGGGGFTMEPDNPALDDYVLSLAAATSPRILFLPTASGDQAGQITAFYSRFHDRECVPEHLSLFRLHELGRPLREIVRQQDIVYVSGGSMRNLLAIWRAHDLDAILIEACRDGTVMAGLSAGAMCWFAGGVTCSSGPPTAIAGLGLIDASLTVHADGEPERLPVWLDCVRRGILPGGWAADDGVGLLFDGHRLSRIVSSRPSAIAQRVDALEGELVRRRLEPELLGAVGEGPPAVADDIREMRLVHRTQRNLGSQSGRIGGR